MRWLALGLTCLSVFGIAPEARAQSLWARRDPQTAYLFVDTRARHIGDVLTIFVNESTEIEDMDKTALNKQTSTSGSVAANANAAAGKSMVRKFAGEVDALVNSQRKFDGTANVSIDRKLVDHMTVVVVDVLPNGNLVVQGRRTRITNNEDRTLVVSGIVRPLDIGPLNVVQSQFIAEFTLNYEGCGPQSSYTQHGWLGRIMNKLWPF